MIEVTGNKPGLLEKFGLYYLNRFTIQAHHHPFDLSDEALVQKVRLISRRGIFLSALVGIVCVFPVIWLDVKYAEASLITHYSILAAAIVVTTLIVNVTTTTTNSSSNAHIEC